MTEKTRVPAPNKREEPPPAMPPGDIEALAHLKQAISEGKHWYIALLEAMGLWASTQETHNGRFYRYLIDGEAFDWLLLAERLCQSVDRLLPEDERVALLFHSKPPLDLSQAKLKKLIGNSKYCQLLNYFYGVTVETALITAVQGEVRKEKWISGFGRESECIDQAYQRIYDAPRAVLLKQFRKERGYPQLRSISLTELKEFTYWLFKYRLAHADRVKVASDTKKALEVLRRQGVTDSLYSHLLPVQE